MGRSSARNPNPNPAKSGPRPAKPGQITAKENPWISFAKSSVIKELRRPSSDKAFFLCCADSALKAAMRRRRRGLFAPASFLFVFISRSSGLVKQAKGWRRFYHRERAGAISVRPCRPRSLHERENGNPGGPRTGRKTARSIRRPAQNTSASQEPEPVPSLWPADGREPFVPKYLTKPVLSLFPSVSRNPRRMRPLSVGRLAPFIQR